uniref:Hepatic and glial cell adhesion molecule n=1 Tax=Leptobrachium leishanense TaxID=445787 RepID=A0A8C5MQL5_9ANUR
MKRERGVRRPAISCSTRLLLACLLAARTEVIEAVNITSPVQHVHGVHGKSALLSIQYSSSSNDEPVIKWQVKRETPVTVVQSIGTKIIGNLRPDYRDRIQVCENGSLLISDLLLSDEGVYEVQISITEDRLPGGLSISLTVDVPISKPRVSVTSHTVLELSENFTMSCVHENGTKPTYTWRKGGKPLNNDSRILLSADHKVLTIRRIMMSDDDIYSCLVENPISNGHSSTKKLTVYRRSSLYIILSTGGIFVLVTLVTVCACWKPSRKEKQKLETQECAEYTARADDPLKQEDEVVSRYENKDPVTLYILRDKEGPEDGETPLHESEPVTPINPSQGPPSRPPTYSSQSSRGFHCSAGRSSSSREHTSMSRCSGTGSGSRSTQCNRPGSVPIIQEQEEDGGADIIP